MAVRANPNLIDDVKHFGAGDVVKCYQCGNCSAACTRSEGEHVFPRKSVRYLQLGLEKPLRSSLEPWLCYYCGECSDQCPRGAEPGETMMSIRRWLTAQYDFTGLSAMLYSSWKSELKAILIVALLTGLGFLGLGFIGGGGNLSVYDGPGAFLPAHYVHIFDWTMGTTLGLLLTINCLRMWYFHHVRRARAKGSTVALPAPPVSYAAGALLHPEEFQGLRTASGPGSITSS